jgi:hypothetical protein
MTSRKLRTLTIEADTYLWRVHHRHLWLTADGSRCCLEVFSALRQGFRGQPLRIIFPESLLHGAGFPRQSGIVMDYRQPTWELNLNRPKAARILIELALIEGWQPMQQRGEFEISNGYKLLTNQPEYLERYRVDPDIDGLKVPEVYSIE